MTLSSSSALGVGVESHIYTNKLTSALEDTQSQKKTDGLSGDFTLRSNQLVEDVGEVVGNQYWGDLNLDYAVGSGQPSEKKVSIESQTRITGTWERP